MSEDASTIFFNPAGMTGFRGRRLPPASICWYPAPIWRTGDRLPRSRHQVGAVTRPIGGSDGGNPYDPTPVPNAYFAYPLMDRNLWVGLGVSAPFGLANKYNADWFGRYNSIETNLLTLDIAPSVAYKVLDWVSIGGGIDIQYADAKLTNAIYTGGDRRHLQAGRRRLGSRLQCRRAVRTVTDHPGRHPLSFPDQPYAGGRRQAEPRRSLPQQSAGHRRPGLPDIIAVGFAHEVTPDLTLMAEYNWYGWSNFKEIRVKRSGLPIRSSLRTMTTPSRWPSALSTSSTKPGRCVAASSTTKPRRSTASGRPARRMGPLLVERRPVL